MRRLALFLRLERNVVEKLVELGGKLVKDSGLRKRMKKECLETIRNGKFSIKARNKKLEKIYREAIHEKIY
jgi:glycosyltransferase involved in cell wall biosynthesis